MTNKKFHRYIIVLCYLIGAISFFNNVLAGIFSEEQFNEVMVFISYISNISVFQIFPCRHWLQHPRLWIALNMHIVCMLIFLLQEIITVSICIVQSIDSYSLFLIFITIWSQSIYVKTMSRFH